MRNDVEEGRGGGGGKYHIDFRGMGKGKKVGKWHLFFKERKESE